MKLDSQEKDGLNTSFWQLDVGGAWTVPAVEMTAKDPSGTVLLMADGGRKSAAAEVAKLLEKGLRVVAVDLSDQGEMVLKRNMLFPLLVAAVGERPLGVQAGQLSAVSRWLADDRGLGPITVSAVGQRASTIALVAAAIDEKGVARLEVKGAMGSLKEVIEQKLSFHYTAQFPILPPQAPELVGTLQGQPQMVARERLGEKVKRPLLHGLDSSFNTAMPGNQHHRCFG